MAGSSSSGSAFAQARKRPHIPLIWCNECGQRQVVERTSRTPKNPNRIFFVCPNHKSDGSGRPFFHWEEEYVDMLRDEACRVQPQVRGKGVQAELRSKVEVPEHDLCALIDVFMTIAKGGSSFVEVSVSSGWLWCVCVLILILIAVLMK
ncbi:hypothetical protein PVAP13_6KG183300 [Panicum virgatum]|uniref:GRF-type domain-containing protein n=1 Tax=Panicum virgatum TaxID=38727 RepID=A0A8T0RAG2_PANVG|nr:hypothetical protein PVAP13_6KG183300 [Panicum virgatum]